MSDDTAPIVLDYSLLNQLENYEDYLSFYIQLEETSGIFSWLRADSLLQMSERLGETSLNQLSKDIRQPRSTIVNYIRAAKAFPQDTRNPMATFSAHLEASFSDSYDEKEGKFITNNRFEWINKVTENSLSTRQLHREIQSVKPENLENENIKLKVTEIMRYLGATKDKALRGEEESKNVIFALHEQLYGRNEETLTK